MSRSMIFLTPPLLDSISSLTPHAHTGGLWVGEIVVEYMRNVCMMYNGGYMIVLVNITVKHCPGIRIYYLYFANFNMPKLGIYTF